MTTLTGVYDTDFNILLRMDDNSLLNFCKTNIYIKSICDNDYFWEIKLNIRYPKIKGLKGKNKIIYLGLKDKYKLVTQAAKSYDCELLEWLKNTFDIVPGGLQMTREGNIPILKWLKNKGVYFSSENYNEAIENNQIEVIKWLISENIIPNSYLVDKLVDKSNIEILNLLASEGILPTENNHAVSSGNLKMVTWLIQHNIAIERNEIKKAIENDRVETIKYLLKNKLVPKNININLVESLQMLNLLLSYNLVNQDMINNSDNIQTLNFLYKKGFVPNVESANNAVIYNKLYKLEWLIQRGIYPNQESINKTDEIDTLELLYKYDMLPDVNGANILAKSVNLEVLEWLANHGVYPDSGAYGDGNSNEIIKWLLEHNIYPDQEMINFIYSELDYEDIGLPEYGLFPENNIITEYVMKGKLYDLDYFSKYNILPTSNDFDMLISMDYINYKTLDWLIHHNIHPSSNGWKKLFYDMVTDFNEENTYRNSLRDEDNEYEYPGSWHDKKYKIVKYLLDNKIYPGQNIINELAMNETLLPLEILEEYGLIPNQNTINIIY